MQIAVIGAGNMGCIYGANLARIGADVTMIDPWSAHVEAMQRHGVTMVGQNGTFTAQVRSTTNGTAVTDMDVALILVNAYDTTAAAQTAQQVL
ncbi:MAG: 2-dehydropantoate 2-reductase N-terminal domain-containing protein, partial [Caldilineaceae bacterium]